MNAGIIDIRRRGLSRTPISTVEVAHVPPWTAPTERLCWACGEELPASWLELRASGGEIAVHHECRPLIGAALEG